MTNIIKLFSIVSLLSVCIYAVAQTNTIAAMKIDSTFASYNAQTPGVAVAVVKNGKIVFNKGYGMANLNDNIPITPQTVFNIASVSKQFTAFAIYLLENEGRLSFEDDVRKYIPELPDYGTMIKIKHLLAHTNGLRDYDALASLTGYLQADISTTEQVLKLLCRQKNLNFTPDSMFGYSNTGYSILAEIVHRITGKTFAEYTSENIFKPLGMTNTQFCDNYEKIVKNKAESYERSDNTYYHKPLNTSNPGPSNLLTTVEDLCKWALNFEKPVVGNPQLIKAFNEPSYFDNGNKVIFRVIDGDTIFHAKGQNVWNYKGVNILSHGGHTAAFRTFLGRFPDQHLSIIQLSNDEYNERLGGRWDIADYYIKDQFVEKKQSDIAPPRNAVTSTTENYVLNLNEFTGKYYSEELETRYNFEVKANKLIMKHIRLDDIALKRIGEYKFSGSGPNTFSFEINFIRNETGKVIGFDISNFGVKNLKFEKQD